MSDTREILVKARELITPPRQWAGGPEHLHDNHCYCAATAIWEAADPNGAQGGTSSAEAVPAGDALARTIGVDLPSATHRGKGENTGDWTAIYNWNDCATHRTVLAAFADAIEAEDG